jgi:NADPH:quinone reductase-like Zn-dependent oxidoreductase
MVQGVRHVAVQLAKAAGAEVIGTASDFNHDFVRSLCADQIIDYTHQPVAEVVKDVDVVVDPRGREDFAKLLDVLRPSGKD